MRLSHALVGSTLLVGILLSPGTGGCASAQLASAQLASAQLASAQLASAQLASAQLASAQLASAQLASAQLASAQSPKTVTVAADGSGNFVTVQQAVDAARLIIHIRPGTYKEKLTVSKDKGPITFEGEDAATTTLTFADSAKTLGADDKELGTSKSASILIQAPDFVAQNITFENSAGPVGQAVAVNVWSDRAVFRKCRFLGSQDTLLTNRNRQYFEDCAIVGSTDFIFGASTAWFERCQIQARQSSFLTAASTPQEQPFGYVFSNCTISGEPSVKTLLGRPWRPYASVTFLNTTMQDVIRPEGWNNWPNAANNGGKDNEKTARYAEYGSKNSNGEMIDLAPRVAWSKRLTAAEAGAITLERVFGDWNPKNLVLSSASIPITSKAIAEAATAVEEIFAPARLAALPAQQRDAWQTYLERSGAHLRADKAALNGELKARGLTQPLSAPAGKDFHFPVNDSTWYGGTEARSLADTILSFQTPSGGWSKAVAFDQGPRRPGMHWVSHPEGWSWVGTFDNNSTTSEMQLLAKVYQATKDRKYADSFLKGLDYSLDSQFPSGGWPQVYPLAGGYHDLATYNDDMTLNILSVLNGVAKGDADYAFVDAARRAKAREAVAATVRFMVQSQIIQDGRRTVWCAQHDPISFAPAAARKFEPASLSGGESLGIVRFLMSIERPTPEIIAAVRSAVAWFESSKITGVEVVKKTQAGTIRGFDTVVVTNPAAPPIWARFYELETNRPIFIGRDAIIRYNLSEIEEERRTGYAWYQPKPRDLLEKDYPVWQRKYGAEVGQQAFSTSSLTAPAGRSMTSPTEIWLAISTDSWWMRF